MYIVIGANGYLGAYIVKNILEKTDDFILAACRSPGENESSKRVLWLSCDVTKDADIQLLNEKYLRHSKSNKIIYLAAYHHPDMVEKHPHIAWDINVTTLSRVINSVENVACFLYPSTDSVYGESFDNYHFVETDALHPVNRYGRNKVAAETITAMYGHHVVRYPFLIAPSLTNKKHFYDFIVETLLQGKAYEMFSDSYRSSLDFNTAAKLTIELCEKIANEEDVPNILNLCGDKSLSKYDIGLMIADKINVSRELIRPISIASSTGIFEAKRASSTLMDNGLLKKVLNVETIQLKL